MAQIDTLFLYNNHEVLRFSDLVVGEGVQANQFCIRHGDRAALIDPGGDLTYTPLTIALSRRISLDGLDYILASHQDPDIIASLPRWLMHTRSQVVVSRFMASNRACRLWVAMVRKLGPRMIVPQHGGYFAGEQVGHFLDWLAALECGVDLLDSQSYRLPVSEQDLTFNKCI
ncbi:MBL fold metallo-hydrolase [Alcanivorax sp. IL2]|uniref:MBL fold metallo-hydrolase n=1 Tax=Alcanivorax sp. IL2 TaxID=3396310 RepID=UPI0039C45486